ncbi:MAG: ABC transporter permease [Chloroflexi bacterium]|nr:ABC transporter permease [Chloroflexota bacterium]
MGDYVLRRLYQALWVLIAVTVVTFFISNLLPGDPALSRAGQFATREQVEATRIRLGLDQPLHIQYLKYMQRLLSGDLGLSITSRQPVLKELRAFFPATLELTIAAFCFTLTVGIPLGIVAGSTKSRWVKSTIIMGSLIGVGIPVFWAGLVFQLVFAGRLDILPLAGRLTLTAPAPPSVTNMYLIDSILAGQWDTFKDALIHLILPAFTLSLGQIGAMARTTNSAMASVIHRDYVRTAHAKGLTERKVLWSHVLRNALLPVVTVLGLYVAFMLNGALLIEIIFSWGGLGTYAWIGIFRNDITVIMGVTLTASLTFMFVNLVIDLTYPFLDPRIQYG